MTNLQPTTAMPPSRPRKIVYRGDPQAEPPPPDLREVLDRYRGRRELPVSLLHEIQALRGYLPQRAMHQAARALGIPLARLHGLATFHRQFRFTPPGRYSIQVCRGTACHVAGSAGILERIGATLGIGQEETTGDKLFSLQAVACVGSCSMAPLMVVNGAVHPSLTPGKADDILRGYAARAHEASE